MKDTARACIDELVSRYPKLSSCYSPICTAVDLTAECFRGNGRLLVCGNGGSAADSLHIVGELMKGFTKRRPLSSAVQDQIRNASPEHADYLIDHLEGALPSVSLVSEVGLTTAYSNDQAPDLCFAQQVLGQGRKGDVLLGISTSGNSSNVLYAAEIARATGIKVIGLTGQSGGKLKEWSDVLINVPETVTYRVQELHLPVYHAFCLSLEEEMFQD